MIIEKGALMPVTFAGNTALQVLLVFGQNGFAVPFSLSAFP